MKSGSHVIDHLPPPTRDDDGGGGGGWALLLTANGLIEAVLVRGLLEAAGVVPVALDAHDPSPGAWMFLAGNVNAPVRVFVLASQLDRARLALLEEGLGSSVAIGDDGAAAVPRPRRLRTVRMLVGVLLAVALAWVVLSDGCAHARFC